VGEVAALLGAIAGLVTALAGAFAMVFTALRLSRREREDAAREAVRRDREEE